jgi:hypothetical protein
MAIYKLFPEKDSTIYSESPTKNTGIDEILEIRNSDSFKTVDKSSRVLIKYPQDEISSIIGNIILNATSSDGYSASLKLFIADTTSLPVEYTLYTHAVSGSWDMGLGKASSSPSSSYGVSWEFRDNDHLESWDSTSTAYSTGSWYSTNAGGGLWHTSSLYESTQSFSYNTVKDVNIDVSNIVKAWYNSDIGNDGFIIKNQDSLEFNPSSSYSLKYFSTDTHTIYPPVLELKWNDFIYSTGSLVTISNQNIVISLGNNKYTYEQDSIQRFRLNVRDKFPARNFQTSSVYLNNKILPTSSYWSIKDLDTEETIVEFDEIYTKISCDTSGNYFDLYMNGLQPERNYKLLFKTVISGSTSIIDNDYYFKITR